MTVLLAADNLALPHVAHGFFTRQGGVSGGIYASLNCGRGSLDDKDDVEINRSRVLACLDLAPDRLVTLYQIHSPVVVHVDKVLSRAEAPRADAMVTTVAGIGLGILTADCAPVLFADREARIIGGAHAGWRGGKGGVLEATIAAMVERGAAKSRIAATVGPCIGKDSYEVGPEFPGPFLEEDAANGRFFRPAARAGHCLFDLGGYVEARLRSAGIGDVRRLDHDTCHEADRFFSYRRACHQGEGDYGRLLSVIALKD
ncbi:MAG: peptidoglycan editing factor PgeF [Proteobacteria bacterium]|nr:peptidoglycan editing factor PgeF [Pseudomonadota bacterium]MBI3497637.1 peptidoglycan editing factor PgeF [Pseudomonadota bacterium]